MILVILVLRVHLVLKAPLVLVYLVYLDQQDLLDLWAVLVSILKFETWTCINVLINA